MPKSTTVRLSEREHDASAPSHPQDEGIQDPPTSSKHQLSRNIQMLKTTVLR